MNKKFLLKLSAFILIYAFLTFDFAWAGYDGAVYKDKGESDALSAQIKLSDVVFREVFYSLIWQQKNIKKVNLQALDWQTRHFQDLANGIEKIPALSDVFIVNLPYIPSLPWETGHAGVDELYRGTGLIKEIVGDGIKHLNPENPDACIIMNYSSLAEASFQEYMRLYGYLIEVEILSEGFEVPLKIERVDKRWIEWMKENGLIIKERVPEGGFKYWHKIKVIKIKPRRIELQYKNGDKEKQVLYNLRFQRKDAIKWNNLTQKTKLELLAILNLKPQDYLWFDKESRRLFHVVCYYQKNMQSLKKAIEFQLKRPMHLSAANFLQQFYNLEERFFSANLIRDIYFSGQNPHFTPEVVQNSRGLLNQAPMEIKRTIIDLFKENFRYWTWDKGISEYLKKEYRYEGGFEIIDITDYSVGYGVYKIRLKLPDSSDMRVIDVFLKKGDSRYVDLRNEVAYLRLEKLFLENANIKQMPFYYRNVKGSDLLITPVINRQSLDSKLSELLQGEKEKPQKDFMKKIVFLLAAHAALGDVLGRNDRHLSNTRIAVDESGQIERLVAFDISNLLDSDRRYVCKDPWSLNYDWIIEDVKQGVSEITLLRILDDYQADRKKKVYRHRLRNRIELLKNWKDRYLKKWNEITSDDNIALIKDAILDVYNDTPEIALEKIKVLDRWVQTDPERFLKEIFRAHLVDFEVRCIYRQYLRQIKEKAGSNSLGYLEKYLLPEEDGYLASRLEAFRGILSVRFLKKRGISGRRSDREVFMNIEKLVGSLLGDDRLRELRREIRRCKREAVFVIRACFGQDSPQVDLLKNIFLPIKMLQRRKEESIKNIVNELEESERLVGQAI